MCWDRLIEAETQQLAVRPEAIQRSEPALPEALPALVSVEEAEELLQTAAAGR